MSSLLMCLLRKACACKQQQEEEDFVRITHNIFFYNIVIERAPNAEYVFNIYYKKTKQKTKKRILVIQLINIYLHV